MVNFLLGVLFGTMFGGFIGVMLMAIVKGGNR